VDPVQFMLKCEGLECTREERADDSRSDFCTLASAYIHLCHRNYVSLELPVQCGQYSPFSWWMHTKSGAVF